MAALTVRPSPTLLSTGKSKRVLGMEKIMENKNPHSDKQTKTQLKEKKSLNIILKKTQALFSCVQKEMTFIVVYPME